LAAEAAAVFNQPGLHQICEGATQGVMHLMPEAKLSLPSAGFAKSRRSWADITADEDRI